MEGLRAELKNVDKDIAKMAPERTRRRRTVEDLDGQLSALNDAVDQADAGVFRAFSRAIGVGSIRDYEDVQLKMAKAENDAMEAFSVQQARIKHQIEFETAQLSNTRERMRSLRATVEKEEAAVVRLQDSKEDLEGQVEKLQNEIERQKRKLSDANTVAREATDKVDELREAARKTQRQLDRALKEIAGWNDEIEKSASARHAIYRRCRLEEIDLPLVAGSLDRVPIEEVSFGHTFVLIVGCTWCR